MTVWGWIVVALVGAYALECALWPYTRCRLCRGTGRMRSPVTRSWRTCRCGGDGQAIRWGARVYAAVGRAFR